MPHDDDVVHNSQVKASSGSQKEDKNYYSAHNFTNRVSLGTLSISARLQSWQCSQNLRGSFLRAVLPRKVKAVAGDRKTKCS